MPTPQEIALLDARGRDLEKRSRLLLGADVSGIRGPAAKAAALSGYLSAIEGKVPTSYDDMVKQQKEADARAALEAKSKEEQQRELDKEKRANAARMAELKARQDFDAKQDALTRADEKEARRAAQEAAAIAAAKKAPLPAQVRAELMEAQKTLSDADTFESFIDDPKNAKQVELYTPAVKANADAMRSDSWIDRTLGNLNPVSGSDKDVENSAEMFAMAEGIYAPIRKGLFGVVLTKPDLDRAAQNQPTPGDSKERLKAKIKVLRHLTAKGLQLMKDVADEQGYNTAGFGVKPGVLADPEQQQSTGTAAPGAIKFGGTQ